METAEVTKLALLEIPDFTTIWNYRREILIALMALAGIQMATSQ